MDFGWLSTPEEYYEQHVKQIFNNVVEALERDEARTFVVADIAFLQMWWQDPFTNIDVKNRFKTLLYKG